MNPSRRRWLHPGASRLALSAGSLLSCGWWLDSPVASARATNTRVIRVDPLGDITTPSQAARRASDGDTVEIEPGIYRADVAVWPQAALRIKARVPGTVRLVADGAAAEQKGIWVLRDGNFHVEGIAFEGARVPHANGAGIRFERGSLRLSQCRFAGNEMGILTGNEPNTTLVIERCEFEGRRQGAQFGHNVYVGRIANVKVSGSAFHTAFRGHLLKSRARVSEVLDCRLIDGPHGQASYELEFPDGGDVLVRGCTIGQEATTQNTAMVSYGVEGYPHAYNRFQMIDTTLENRASSGVFVRIAPGPVETVLRNNRFRGPGELQGVRT